MQFTIAPPSKGTLIALLVGAVLGMALAHAAPRLPHIHIDPRPTPTPAPIPPAPPAPPAPAPKPDWFGWRDDGGFRAIAATMPTLSQAAPHLLVRDAADRRPVLLYKAWTDLFKACPPYPSQQIGDCVSFGHSHGHDLLQCVEWCLTNPGKAPTPADIAETDTEALYGMAREAGNMLGSGDGCYGAAAVKAMTTMGLVSRRMLGADGVYSGRRAKQWGRTGAPANVKEMAAAHKLGAAANVSTWEELCAALANGNPVTICTGMGFTLQRDGQGFVRRSGRWGHCMVIAGVRFDREGACVLQSWGMATPGGPLALDQPPYSFWIERKDAESILAEGDSWALSKAAHFGGGASARGRRRHLPPHWRRAGGPHPARPTAATGRAA